jgi:hypothetical protein
LDKKERAHRVNSRQQYLDMLAAVGICFSTRIPVLLWGDPGNGKTAVIESAREQGWHVETLICSHYEPSDFAGLPVVKRDGSVQFAPPSWAARLAAHDGPSIAFLDEFSCSPPSVQAAALRPLTHYEVGALQLPPTVSWGAAANPADVAAAGWELAPPTASRFVHLDWGSMPIDIFTECLLAGGWPTIPLHSLPAAYAGQLAASRALVSAYLRIRQSQLSAIPKDAASRGKAFPTPRTWDYASRLLALVECLDANLEVKRLLVFGAVGASSGHEFLAWAAQRDLPDPEELLADSSSTTAFMNMRPDRIYATLAGVLAAVSTTMTPDRWVAALRLCAAAASAGSIDAAVPIVRALVRDGVRPEGSAPPAEIAVFAGPLALAGLMKAPAA